MKSKILNIIILFELVRTSLIAGDFDFLSVNGYGSLGVAYQDNDEILYRNSLSTRKGSQGDYSLSNYSNLGLQLDFYLTDKATFTLQGVASENNSESNQIELSWANLNYQITDEFSMKLGKMRIPAFMYSDILNVSYSYDWVKLPQMYSIIPLQNYEGIELNYNFNYNDLTINSTLLSGQSKSVAPNNKNSKNTIHFTADVKGAMLNLLYRDFTLRFAYADTDTTFKNRSLDQITGQFDSLNIPVISNTINQYAPKKVDYLEIGGKYDFENAYLVGEYMKVISDNFLSDNISWYVGTGYNFEKWSPFILYSRTTSSSNYKDIPIDATTPVPYIGAITMANQTFNTISNTLSNIDAETKSIGLRYNINEKIVFKFQYDNYSSSKDSFLHLNYSDNEKIKLDIFSTSINFIF